MAHKTFISYKYSESQVLRDRIIEALGDDASYYQGETSDSPDISDLKTESIKKHLKDMLYNTSVTIVILSPNMKQSKWIDWEIEYSLKSITRNDRTSHPNGIVGVISKVNGSYDWLVELVKNEDGCQCIRYHTNKLYDIINNNRFNQSPLKYECDVCKTVDTFTGSYIAFVTETDFIEDPNKYIANAYEKSKNDAAGYDLRKTR